jgi:hypothetical protein
MLRHQCFEGIAHARVGKMKKIAPFALAALLLASCNELVGNQPVAGVPESDSGAPVVAEGGDASPLLDAGDATANDSATDGPPVDVAVEIVSAFSGNCIDVGGNTEGGGSVVVQNPCTHTAEQLFVLKTTVDGLLISNPNSGMCIGVRNVDGGNLSKAPVQLLECSAGSADVFKLVDDSGPFFFILQDANYPCLDDEGFGAAPDAAVQLFGCNGGPNQLWSPTRMP